MKRKVKIFKKKTKKKQIRIIESNESDEWQQIFKNRTDFPCIWHYAWMYIIYMNIYIYCIHVPFICCTYGGQKKKKCWTFLCLWFIYFFFVAAITKKNVSAFKNFQTKLKTKNSNFRYAICLSRKLLLFFLSWNCRGFIFFSSEYCTILPR